MAFQEVSTQKKFIKYSECEKGKLLVEGTYLGSKETKFGTEYEFKSVEGILTVLNNAGHLEYLLKNYAKVGDVCRVVYDGQDTLEKGAFKGKPAHRFKLAIDVQEEHKTESTMKDDLSRLD